jgi:hypothetical protein
MTDPRRDRALAASAVLFATSIAARGLEVPNDLFWHLAIAREIWHRGFPRVDPFAFSTNAIAWSPPEWLGEMAFGAAYVSLGWAGTTLLTLAAIVGCFAAIQTAARTVAPTHTAALALLAFAWPAAVHLPMRPLVLGDLCFTILVARLFALRAGDARGLAWMPLLFAIWANVHPSWPMGLAVLWMHAIVLGLGPAIAARAGLVVEPLAAESRRPLAIAALVSPLAVLARPDGIDGALYPFVHVVGLGHLMTEIIEWFPPDYTQPVNLALVALLAITLALALRDRKRIHVLDVLLVALGAFMALRYQRFLPLAAFLATPVLARGLSRTKLAPLDAPLRIARLLLAVAIALVVLRTPSSRELADGVRDLYPESVVRWALRHPLPPRAFNTFEDGGFLAWRFPHRQVFIDSRFDLYARAGVFEDYLALRRGERIAEIVERYRLDAAIVPTAERDENFAALEAALPGLGFTLVHEDDGTHLWTRETRGITSLHP